MQLAWFYISGVLTFFEITSVMMMLNTYYTQSNKILTNIHVGRMGMQSTDSTDCDWHCQQILKCRGLIWHGVDILANSDSGLDKH